MTSKGRIFMYTLFIDTHFKNINLCLYENVKIINKTTLKDVKSTSECTMPEIINLLAKSKIESQNISNIIVCNGPGSFTGVRIGVTIAKTFAYCTNANIYTIDSLTLASLSYTGDNYIAVKENNGIYLAKFHNENMTSNIEYYRNKEIEALNYKDNIKYETETPNFERLIEIITKLPKCNAFNANPIYIKTIEALHDNKD